MGDDVGMWNIGAYHRGMMAGKTPNLDKLAKERHVVHRLLRRGKLHGGSRELHHRRAADPHQHDHGRPGRCIGRFASDGAVRARVRDFGTGLPSNIPERVFDRFFSTKREGMGIGLFIARSIVAAHGGTLLAENAEGGGAQFCLRLPVSKEIGV